MKKILLIGHAALASSFQQEGFQVLTVGSMENAKFSYNLFYETVVPLGKILEDAEKLAFLPDYIFYHDDGNLPWVVDMESRNIPAIYYSVDTFCNPWHIPFSAIFDYALVAQKDFLPLFLQLPAQAIWFPLFCSSSIIPNFTEEDFLNRPIPVAFVGTLKPKNIPQRESFLLNFKKKCPLLIKQGNYIPVFTQSQIVLNQSAASEVNYRVFESTALGAALLNENIRHGLSALYTPGEDILPTYHVNDHVMAAEIAAEYLTKPLLLAEIAYKGWYKTKNHHTDTQRAKKIIKLFENIPFSPPTAQIRSHREEYAKKAFQILACELMATLPQHAEFYQNYKKS